MESWKLVIETKAAVPNLACDLTHLRAELCLGWTRLHLSNAPKKVVDTQACLRLPRLAQGQTSDSQLDEHQESLDIDTTAASFTELLRPYATPPHEP